MVEIEGLPGGFVELRGFECGPISCVCVYKAQAMGVTLRWRHTNTKRLEATAGCAWVPRCRLMWLGYGLPPPIWACGCVSFPKAPPPPADQQQGPIRNFLFTLPGLLDYLKIYDDVIFHSACGSTCAQSLDERTRTAEKKAALKALSSTIDNGLVRTQE